MYKSLIGGGNQELENKELLKQIEELKKQLQQKDETIKKQEEMIAETKVRVRTKKDIDIYNIKNLNKFLKTQEYKDLLKNPEIFEYNEGVTAFDKNLKKNPNYFYKYQKDFIENWAVSQQEMCILYYGVGTGKTLIAVNCAEQFLDIYPNSYVYFLSPASLVFTIINNMFKSGIDPTRKNKDGEYIYNFLSYQQLLNSKLNFKENSLLIIDEVHNLRNFKTKGISEKVSARKWKPTDTYSLVGTKLGIELLQSKNKFLRSIFMTGTLFVNSIYDIEPIISIGYKKAPLTDFNLNQLILINNNKERRDVYYGGLISYYRRPVDTPNFPRTNYIFELLEGDKKDEDENEPNEEDEDEGEHDAYFINSRNEYNQVKVDWIIKFLKKNKKEKTLIYAQFINRLINKLLPLLDKNKIKYGLITGSLDMTEKQEIVSKYNNGDIKVLIFTLAIKEGISFKETNNFIMTQPYWNYAITEQIIARGIRADSHKKGNKSVVNVYLLCAVSSISPKVKEYAKFYQNIMNNDIKKYINKYVDKEKIITENEEKMKGFSVGRDINLYFRMLKKQAEINEFENKLLNEVPRFEQSNNLENNEFIKEYNKEIIKKEKKNKKLLTNKEKKELKNSLYDKYYKKNIEKINKQIIRFDKDTKFRQNRNPDLVEIASNIKYDNVIDKIKKMLSKGDTLNKILTSFNISKQEITSFQANFTPQDEVNKLIEASGIKDDNRQNLFILEPTAGIGNVISQLLKLKNNENFNIDGVEIHNLFYQIAQAQFDNLSNVKMYNMDFIEYNQKYNYDYIIGNPPFNLRTTIDVIEKDKKTKQIKIVKQDTVLYDVDFVAKAYNQLKDDGKLSMIISNTFMRGGKSSHKAFVKILEILQQQNKDNVKIIPIDGFKIDATTVKEMETTFKMVIINLKKVKGFYIDFKKVMKDVETDELLDIIREKIKTQKKEIKTPKKEEQPKEEKPKVKKTSKKEEQPKEEPPKEKKPLKRRT